VTWGSSEPDAGCRAVDSVLGGPGRPGLHWQSSDTSDVIRIAICSETDLSFIAHGHSMPLRIPGAGIPARSETVTSPARAWGRDQIAEAATLHAELNG
jgi:hypothetical protein